MKRKYSEVATYGSGLIGPPIFKPYKKRKLKIPRSIISKIRNKNKEEIKFLDTTLATTAITATGIIVNDTIVGINQGDGPDERNGRKVNLTSIHLRGVITQPSGQTSLDNSTNLVRVILYWDKQCNAATASIATILDATETKSYLNLDNVDRYTILSDMFVDMDVANIVNLTSSAFTSPRLMKYIKFNKKCNIPIRFNDNGNTIASITSNNIGVAAIALTANGTFLDVQARVRFTDN